MPAALVDWDATKKVEAEDAHAMPQSSPRCTSRKTSGAPVRLDIDASLEAAPGVFLPSGVGLWAFNGHRMQPLTQAEINSQLSKGRLLER